METSKFHSSNSNVIFFIQAFPLFKPLPPERTHNFSPPGGTRAYLGRKIHMPRKTIPTRKFRIHQRQDGRYVSLSGHPGDSPLGVDYSLAQAIGTATREATLVSRQGCKVVIEVQQSNKSWKEIDVIKPPTTR